ncbi:MAG TPA: TetR/AcrR family transcriptional regulator [Acidimicrobiales bacterium]|jgi:AcrR family transcriptional regulator|nr:TetR/AcrR family transcriptional regulator [Acidimicrobiales bacterium]
MSTVVAPSRPRRQAILDAALECFLANTVSATKIDAIRDRSGASVGSIYHFFGSKDGLATQLYVEVLADHHANYLDALRTSRSAKAGVTGAVHAHLRWVAANRDGARYVFNWREPEVIDRRQPALTALNEELYRVGSEWLAGHVRAGRIQKLSPRMFQALWMGATLEYARLWMAHPTSADELVEAGDALAAAAWQAVRGRRA